MFVTNKHTSFAVITTMLIVLIPSLLLAWTGEVKEVEDGDLSMFTPDMAKKLQSDYTVLIVLKVINLTVIDLLDLQKK